MWVNNVRYYSSIDKLLGRPPQYARPLQVDLLTLNESGVRVTCDVAYLCTNFSLGSPLCSRLRPDVRDRRASSFNAPTHRGGA